MNPIFKATLVMASLIAALLYGAPEDFWTKVASGLIVVAVSIALNYWLTSRTANLRVAEEMGAYKKELESLRSEMSDHGNTMKSVLQELGTVQGELKQISRRR